ncbi:MAG: uroporphyrinogen-III synthase [Verrucomicrobia bacterium]|nr:uroporphyrinogen-III synthase [Verrucomicrobiota bacterium]
MHSSKVKPKVRVGCRPSPLSLSQFHELQQLVDFPLEAVPTATTGCLDRSISLRSLDKTDFFTREIDQLLLEKEVRLALHSAKDLPDPLPQGLVLAALTKGLDPADALVFRPYEDLATLPQGSIVATSSQRREEAVSKLRSDFRFVDVRGNVNERLQLLYAGKIDALVVAEAALIRLGLTDLSRIRLPGETAPLQGQLAVIARSDDVEMQLRLAHLDSRPLKRVAYFGLDPTHFATDGLLFHLPLIEIEPLETPSLAETLTKASHILFTSKTTVKLLIERVGVDLLKSKTLLSIGKVTTAHLKRWDLFPVTAEEETAEGLLHMLPQNTSHVAYPHSTLARPVIFKALESRPHTAIPLYTPRPHLPFALDLQAIDELVFTSPSTVLAFEQLIGFLPTGKKISAQGQVTQAAIDLLQLRAKQSIS